MCLVGQKGNKAGTLGFGSMVKQSVTAPTLDSLSLAAPYRTEDPRGRFFKPQSDSYYLDTVAQKNVRLS